MAIEKIVGIETEFGIMVRGAADWNPIAASSLLINSYVGALGSKASDGGVSWDFADETPGADARHDYSSGSVSFPEVETNLVNTVLTNGARFYVDHAHPEMSTPECRDAHSAVLYDRAGELILIDAMRAAEISTPPGQEIIIYKDNSDRKGNAYGCHENYLLDRKLPFGEIVAAATTHFVSRQIFTGSGKVGTELAHLDRESVPFQITQRAEHFEEEVGLETTLKRPIVNTRDEPHADSKKYRRLHVIAGDANMSQVATLLKVGTSAIIFAMLEDGAYKPIGKYADPVRAMHHVSHDTSLAKPIEMQDGTQMTALEIQFELLAQAQSWAENFGLESVGESSGKEVLERWQDTLEKLETNPDKLDKTVDWIAKRRLLLGFMDRHGCDWTDSRLRALDLQYHDLRPEKSLAKKLSLESLFTETQEREAVTEPPTDTRAYFRGKCLQKYPESVVAANWDSIVFDVGTERLRRVPMLEPARGTKDHVAAILADSEDAVSLLEKLGS